jgi:cytochrome c oxidase assembly protein subunit 15
MTARPALAGDPRYRPRQLSWWLFLVAGLVFAIVIVGGTTRLTQSGLSITTWKPVSGVVPPITQADWQVEFDNYRASPEYRLVNNHMSMADFKGIFWWEWAHRLLGRVLGLVLVVPFVWFLARRRIPPGYGWRLAGLAVLVGLQGVIGWWMVASGLVDRPDVAHERLALHLTTALILLAALVWVALDLRALGEHRTKVAGRPRGWVVPFVVVLFVQFVLGAFVAGLDAGRIYNTWPTMQGSWMPAAVHARSPVWTNAVDNPIGVQFLHRWWAVVVALAALGVAVVLFRAGARKLATALEVVVLVQFVLGVLTLLHAVPVGLGIAHQAVGALLLVVTVVAAHWSLGGARGVPGVPASPVVGEAPVTSAAAS